MLFQQRFLDGIAAGRINRAFRRWKRPTVRAGGTLRTAVGVLAIESVETIDPDDITPADAERAGYASAAEVRESLREAPHLPVYVIRFHHHGEDPRIDLRNQTRFTPEERDSIAGRLARLDKPKPWTIQVLRLIQANPATRAGNLAASAGMPVPEFKLKVRKLKELGLTESLEVGYRISPRGEAWLKAFSE